MKLNVYDANIGTQAASMVSFGCMNFMYSFDMPIKDALAKAFDKFEEEIEEDMLVVKTNNDITDEEREFSLELLNNLKSKLKGGINDLLSCFDKIEILVEKVGVLENIDEIIGDINIPIVLNLKGIDEEYLLENLSTIDSLLKEKHSNRITYLINQCLDDTEAHFEDNSYSLEDVLLVLTSIRDLTNVVRQFNLSPLEQIMYVYDIVKDRSYVEADKNDSYLESRDMARIHKSDKIVCLGFASLLKSLLDNLGFTNEIIYLDSVVDTLPGHARNVVSINDPKYNLDHIFYYDATWDSKRFEADIIDEDRYENFAREKVYFIKKDIGRFEERRHLPYYLRKDNNYNFIHEEPYRVLFQIKGIFKMINWKNYFASIEITDECLNKVMNLMSDDLKVICFLGQDYDFCEFMYKECSKMLGRKLPNDAFLRSLYTVRKVENYLNPDKYNFDLDQIIEVYYKYTMPDATNEEKFLLREIFGQDRLLKKKLMKYNMIDGNVFKDNSSNNLGTLNEDNSKLEVDSNNSVKASLKLVKK